MSDLFKDGYERTALFFAVSNSQWDAANHLLDKNANAKVECSCCKTTALSKAAEKGNIKVVQRLVKENALVNRKNLNGETAIKLAERFGHKEVVRALRRFKEVRKSLFDYMTILV